MSRVAAAAALLMVLCLVGCGGSPEARPSPTQPARGYHPERFPDIPLPPGFSLDPTHDQLAIAVGGGLLRRFDVSLVQKAKAKSQTPTEVLTWYGQLLPGFGWTADAESARERCFRRVRSPEVGELLRISASSTGGVTSLRLRLEPAPPVATTP